MGLWFRHFVAPSTVHGLGLFAAEPIRQGSILWQFDPSIDRRICLAGLTGQQRFDTLHYGYINPQAPDLVVVCGDDARYWNFPQYGSPANAIVGAEFVHGEALIIASHAICPGDEMLIDPASDADYFRKVSAESHQCRAESWPSAAG